MSTRHLAIDQKSGVTPATHDRVLPRVILHNAVSIDGCISGFEADLGVY